MKLQDIKTINKQIASIKGRSAKLDADIHNTAVQCLMHAEQHGDFTLCGKLVGAMGNSARRQDMIVWFKTFGPVKINTKTFEASKRKKHENEYAPFDVETAEKTPFWELIEDKPGQPMGLADLVGVLFSRRRRAIEANEEGRYVGNFNEDLAVIDAAIAATGISEDSLEAVQERTKNLKDEFKSKPVPGAKGKAKAEPAH